MHAGQRKTFLKYLAEAGAIVEGTWEPEKGESLYSGMKFAVWGRGLKVIFYDAYGHMGLESLAHYGYTRAPQPGEVVKPMTAYDVPVNDEFRQWTHYELRRLTTCGKYRYTVKVDNIQRYAAPLRALAAEVAALQARKLPPAHSWTPDALEGFSRMVRRALDESAPPQPSTLDALAWMHYSSQQRKAISAWGEAARACADHLERGLQPPDDLVRTFDEARARWIKLKEGHETLDAERTLDALPISRPALPE